MQQINETLRKIKDTINSKEGTNFHFKNRYKNQETLIKLGYLHHHVLEEILSLTYRNYCDGPEPNLSRSGERKGAVWTFGKIIEEIEIYIKIQIIPHKENNKCVCISFHEAINKMNYPYAS